MLTCADCKAVDCANVGIDTNACDNYTGEEAVDEKTWGNPILDKMQEDIDGLKDYTRGIHEVVLELERKFDTIIAAVIKAAGPEEER